MAQKTQAKIAHLECRGQIDMVGLGWPTKRLQANEESADVNVLKSVGKKPPLTTSHSGNNADLISAVADFYISDGSTVADVTYGSGAFWRKTDDSRFILLKADLYPR